MILSAGAIGSTEILLKSINTSHTTGQKLNLSNRLGKGYSTNGDLLGVINPTKTDINATRGPIVTSAIKFNEGSGFVYTLEDSNIPNMFAGVSRFLSQSNLFRNLLGYAGTGKAHRAIIEIPEGFESSRMDQASMKTLVANDGYLSFRYEGTYGSFSENTWKGP